MPGPGRVTIETIAGKVLAARTNPRASFAGRDLDTIQRNTIHD
jgi:hypothetical protein